MTGTATTEHATASFLAQHHPFDLLPPEALDRLATEGRVVAFEAGEVLYEKGQKLASFTIVLEGAIDVVSPDGEVLTRFLPGEGIGARALLRDGTGPNRAVAGTGTRALAVPKAVFLELVRTYPDFAHFFERLRRTADRKPIFAADTADPLITNQLGHIMTRSPVSVASTATVQEAAALMRGRGISFLPVVDGGALVGLLTTSDLAARVVAEGLSAATPVLEVMTRDPATLPPEALVFDALLLMGERHIGHLPIVDKGELVGILTRTNLIRRQSISVAFLIGDINEATEISRLAAITADVPLFLAQLVGAGVEAYKVGKLVTSITDALTKRLLVLAGKRLGPAPVPWLWLACGSQGRREQTGFSDQDNCLILDDSYAAEADEPYFAELARFVSDGLDACGYYYCPGEMMATTPRWRVPLRQWRAYFRGWIAEPDPTAQMLSSVMFDLRPIVGETALFAGLQRETLEAARRNSIFRAHMISAALKHTPPLSLFQNFTLIRSGEHRNTLDLKFSGVVPIVDLARIYALDGGIEEVNTRERLIGARAAGTLSEAGAGDLVDAYDLISRIRLEHQARQVRDGQKPDNYMAPSTLSALERRYLKDAFGVVKAMQAALRSRSA